MSRDLHLSFTRLLAFLAVLLGTVASAHALPKVAILAASSSSGPDVQMKLMATGAFDAVDVIEVWSVTPTLMELKAYDAVAIYSYLDFADNIGMGDVLADYLESGGGVVLFDYEAMELGIWQLDGRYFNEYTLMEPQDAVDIANKPGTLGTVREPGSPLMAGVNTFKCDSCNRLTSKPKAGAVVVAEWDDGTPLVLRGFIKGHTVVELNFFAPSADTGIGEWDPLTDGGILIKNALLYSMAGPVRADVGALSFPDTPVGQSSTKSFKIVNSDAVAQTITALSTSGGDAGDFKVRGSAPLPAVVQPGASYTVEVDFVPTQVAPRATTLRAAVSNQNDTTVALSGTGLPATLVVNPSPVAFGGLAAGGMKTITATLTNATANAVSVQTLAVTAGGADFTVTPASAPPLNLGPGATLDFNVTFKPAATGHKTGAITITAVGFQPLAVPLAGSSGPPQIALDNNAVVFGNAHVGASSAPQALRIRNPGFSDLNVTAISLTGANAADFKFMAPMLPAKIPPNGAVDYQVTFSPMALGMRLAKVTVTSSDPAMGAITYDVSGNGVAFSQSVAPNMLDFGSVKSGTTSMSKTTTLSNTSQAPLNLVALSITGPQAAWFSIGGNPQLPLAVAAGGTHAIPVVFKPQSASAATATLTITVDDPQNPTTTVALKGQGTSGMISVSPAMLDLGGVAIGKTSSPGTVTISNQGVSTLTIKQLEIAGNDAVYFSIDSFISLPEDIAPGASLDVDVIFEPAFGGAGSAALVIRSDDPGSPEVQVPLSAVGTQAKISVNPLVIDFGVTAVGVPTAPVPVVVSNTGDEILELASIEVTGTGAPLFRLDPASPDIVVEPGKTAAFNVRFVPTAAVHATATLVLTPSDDGLVPVEITLKGSALSGLLGVDPMSIDFGLATIGRPTAGVPITLRNTGSAPITLAPPVASPTVFTLDSSGPITIPAKGTVTINALFTATSTMPVNGKVDFALAALPTRALASVLLQGEGVEARIDEGGDGSSGGCALGGRPSRAPLAGLALVALTLAIRLRARRRGGARPASTPPAR